MNPTVITNRSVAHSNERKWSLTLNGENCDGPLKRCGVRHWSKSEHRVVPYNLEPYANDFNAKCGGKTLATNKHISLDHYFLELQTLFMDILALRVLIKFGKKPHSFMSNNPYLFVVTIFPCESSSLVKYLNKSFSFSK